MKKETRQALSDNRRKRGGNPMVPVPESKDVPAYGKGAAGKPSARPGGLPVLAVYCAPCGVTATPHALNTTPRFTELCECVSVAMGSNSSTNEFSNTASVFLSPTKRVQASLLTVEESQLPRAVTQRRTGSRKESKPEPEIITARLDTGATCHDFVSQATADALVARGASLEPMSGRVCSAFQGEERLLKYRLICKYGFFNHLTRTVQRITIRPVILPALRAPLIIELQTIGEHGLLEKQLPSLCQPTTEEKRTIIPRSPIGTPLTREEDTARETAAGGKRAKVRHRTPDSPLMDLDPTGKWRRELPVEREVCELCTLPLGSRDFFGDGDDSEDEEIERPPINIASLLPSHANGGEGAALSAVVLESIDKIIFEGSEMMQTRARALCQKYKSRFAESVVEQAAHVPPMALEIDADLLCPSRGL